METLETEDIVHVLLHKAFHLLSYSASYRLVTKKKGRPLRKIEITKGNGNVSVVGRADGLRGKVRQSWGAPSVPLVYRAQDLVQRPWLWVLHGLLGTHGLLVALLAIDCIAGRVC